MAKKDYEDLGAEKVARPNIGGSSSMPIDKNPTEQPQPNKTQSQKPHQVKE
jgi:hypothetical protein